MIESKHFTVINESKDFVTIKVDLRSELNGVCICDLNPSQAYLMHQYLLDEYGLMQVDSFKGRGLAGKWTVLLTCRKVKEQA